MYEIRNVPGDCELRAGTGDKLKIIGYAAVFGKRSQNLGGFVEEVHPSAFNKTLGEADIRGLFNHSDDTVLGRNRSGTLHLSTDEHGLHYEIDANAKDPDHQRVIFKIERGDVTGSSFAFRVVGPDGATWGLTEDDFPLRTLREVALFDVGPVTFPAYLDTDSGLAKRALRSLAASREIDVEEVLAAAARGELRSLIVPADPPAAKAPEQTSTPLSGIRANRNRLELLRHTLGPVGNHPATPSLSDHS